MAKEEVLTGKGDARRLPKVAVFPLRGNKKAADQPRLFRVQRGAYRPVDISTEKKKRESAISP
jgi:hypothetical protein